MSNKNSNHDKVDKIDFGSLLYIADTSGKVRPFICLGKFTNKGGVVYDFLVAPITSMKTVGNNNLVEVKHSKLKKPSYVKLNNVTTLPATEAHKVELCSKKFTQEQAKKVQTELRYLIGYIV